MQFRAQVPNENQKKPNEWGELQPMKRLTDPEPTP